MISSPAKIFVQPDQQYEIHSVHFFPFHRKQPSNNDDWLTLLKQQEALHSTETTQWQHILQAAIDLLKQVNSIVDFSLHSPKFQKIIFS